jgi:hypothetical protein
MPARRPGGGARCGQRANRDYWFAAERREESERYLVAALLACTVSLLLLIAALAMHFSRAASLQ